MEADLMVGWVPYLSQFECNKIISHSLSPGTLIGKRNTSDQDWRLFFLLLIVLWSFSNPTWNIKKNKWHHHNNVTKFKI
jgi:hypothetical protein